MPVGKSAAIKLVYKLPGLRIIQSADSIAFCDSA